MKKYLIFFLGISIVSVLENGCRKESVRPSIDDDKIITSVSGRGSGKPNQNNNRHHTGNNKENKSPKNSYTGANPLKTNWKHPNDITGGLLNEHGKLKKHASVKDALGKYIYESRGIEVVSINNQEIQNTLAKVGEEYRKVYDHALVDNKHVELHYFRRRNSKEIFDIKTHLGEGDYDAHYNNKENHKKSPFFIDDRYN